MSIPAMVWLLLMAAGVQAWLMVASGEAPMDRALTADSSLPVDVAEAIAVARNYQPEAGIWGDLEARYLTLEPPDRLVDEIIGSFPWRDGPVWDFEGDLPAVIEMMRELGLTPPDTEEASDDCFSVAEGVVKFRPPTAFIEQLSAEQRPYLYRFVAPFEKWNPYHVPLALNPKGFRYMAAMEPSGLSPELIDLVDRLSYRRAGRLYFFSDLGYGLRQAHNDVERQRLIKTLGRQFSIQLKLRISRDSDLDALSAYWGGRGRNKEVMPLLASVAETSGVEILDVVHLLPPTARKLLHSFPHAEMGLGDSMPDCFSTAASFFFDEPPTRHLDSVRHVIDERYQKADQPWQFGDLIQMSDPDTGKVVHACNYVAADIVFTKNGQDRFRPWILARVGNVMNEYLTGERLVANFYRLKPEFQR